LRTPQPKSARRDDANCSTVQAASGMCEKTMRAERSRSRSIHRKIAGHCALLSNARLRLLMHHVVASSVGGAVRLPNLDTIPLPSDDSQTIGRVFLCQGPVEFRRTLVAALADRHYPWLLPCWPDWRNHGGWTYSCAKSSIPRHATITA
jgi:hypothetical protein